MTEELLTGRSRLAAALIAGPAVTVGMLGAGVAPALADEEVGSEDQVEDEATEDADEGGSEADGEGEAADEEADPADIEDESDEAEEVEAEADDADDGGEDEPADDEASEEDNTEEVEAGDEDGAEDDAEEDDAEEDEDAEEDDSPGFNLTESTYWFGQDLVVEFRNFPANTEAEVIVSDSEEEVSLGTVEIDDEGNGTFSYLLTAEESVAGHYNLSVEHEELSFFGGISFEVREAPPESEEDFWWYGAPDSHTEEGGYADWVQAYIDGAVPPDSDEIGGRFEYDTDAVVRARPSLDAEVFGPLTDPDPDFTPGYDGGAHPIGYLADLDFWIMYDPYAKAVGFVAGSETRENPPEPGEGDQTITVGEDGAQGYAEGDLDSEIIREFEPGEELIVAEFGEEWIEVVIDEDGNTAFIPAGAIDEEDDDDDEDDDVDPGDDEDDASDEDEAPGDDEDDASGDESEVIELSLDADSVAAGDEVTVYGEGFAAEEEVEISLNPELGSFATDEDGVLTAVVTIPEDTEPGEYTISAVGQDSGVIGEAALAVTEPAGPAPAGGAEPAPEAKGPQGEELAATGMTARDAGLASGLLLLIGGGLAALGYKNRIGRRGTEEA